jgi:hypothetical protein
VGWATIRFHVPMAAIRWFEDGEWCLFAHYGKPLVCMSQLNQSWMLISPQTYDGRNPAVETWILGFQHLSTAQDSTWEDRYPISCTIGKLVHRRLIPRKKNAGCSKLGWYTSPRSYLTLRRSRVWCPYERCGACGDSQPQFSTIEKLASSKRWNNFPSPTT